MDGFRTTKWMMVSFQGSELQRYTGSGRAWDAEGRDVDGGPGMSELGGVRHHYSSHLLNETSEMTPECI